MTSYYVSKNKLNKHLQGEREIKYEKASLVFELKLTSWKKVEAKMRNRA